MEKLYTFEEIRDHLQVSDTCLRNWIKWGLIHPIRIGKRRMIRFTESEVNRFLKEPIKEGK